MTNEPQAIFKAALALPEKERAALAQLLLESLSDEPAELNEDELFAELDRRRADVDQGVADAVPWSQLRDEE